MLLGNLYQFYCNNIKRLENIRFSMNSNKKIIPVIKPAILFVCRVMVRKDWVNRLLGVCRATDCVSAGPRNLRNIFFYVGP